jgi:Leucine-rich repeat (LRR) protein
MGSLDAAQSRPSVVDNSIFTGELVNTKRGEDDSFSRFAKHTESSGMHSFTATGSGGERRVETNATVASVEAGDEETLLVQIRDATRSSAKISLVSSEGPSDGPVLEAKNPSQIERKKPSFNQLPAAEKESLETSSLACAVTPEMKSRNREDDPIGLLHAIGSHGKNLSPFVHQSTDEDMRVHTKLADWSMDTLVWTQSPSEEGSPFFDPSKISVSNSGNDLEEQRIPSSDDFKHSKKQEPTRRCMFLPFLVVLLLVGAASLIVLFRFGVFSPDNNADSVPSVSPGVAAIAPSVVPFHSDMPSTPFPSTAVSDVPSASPTMSSVSFESVYEIFIRDGLAEDIPRKEYAKDLIESMNRLLNKVLVDLSLDDSRKPPPRLLAPVIPSSEIERFQTTNCPNQDLRNRCEKVFAYITLENAVNSWAEVKVFLDLAVSIGQLQFELDQVNPSSPVAIIDLIEEHEPSPVPSPVPSRSVSPTAFSQIPSMSPSSLTISPNTSSWSPTTDSYLLDLLTENSFDGGEALRTQGSAQNRAYLWLLEDSFLDMYSDARLLQRYALATFYYSTHGEDWFFQTNWLSDMDECFWYSRSPQSPCDIDGGLQNLELDYNNINGELPPELGLLSDSLERIVLRGGPNSVTSGTLPSELGYLTKMANFFIRGNHFAGSLPYQLGRWTALEQFDISGNRFTGTLPPSLFANAVQLSFIDISNNRFTGSLPTQVGNMEKCQRFIIENNMITGAIPTEIGDLRRLQSFYGGSNMLSSLPSEIGRLTFLDTLALQQNTFMGTIPSELSRIQRLLILDLSSNSLSGPIPSRMSKTTDFMKFPTSSNTKLSPSFRTW